jgi:putative endonuclease
LQGHQLVIARVFSEAITVYYEIFRDVRNVISREKQIKGGSRAKKIELINVMNAGWKELYDGL